MHHTKFWMVAAAAVAITGCSLPDGPVSRDTTGRVLGSSQWETITLQASGLTIRGDISLLQRWERNQLPERYQERIALVGGSLFYERLYGAAFRDNEPQVIRDYLDRQHQLSANGFTLSEVTRSFKTNGKLHYLIGSKERAHCISFMLEGSIRSTRNNAAASGYLCRNESQMPKADLEKLGLDLLSRIDFSDEGKQNALRPTGAATVATAHPPSPEPNGRTVAAAATVPPSPASAASPVATAAIATTPTPQGHQDVRPIAVQWTGYADPIAGTVEVFDAGRSGTLKMTLPNKEGLCGGTYTLIDGARGTWVLACSNGLTARGTFQPRGTGRGSMGAGLDSKGGQIRFTMGGG